MYKLAFQVPLSTPASVYLYSEVFEEIDFSSWSSILLHMQLHCSWIACAIRVHCFREQAVTEFGPWRNGMRFGNVSQGCWSFYSVSRKLFEVVIFSNAEAVQQFQCVISLTVLLK